MKLVGITVLALCVFGVLPVSAQSESMSLELGRRVYRKACFACHGARGDGNGPGAKALDPRPRNFTEGLFKFRSTTTGELPTDADLLRVVSQGVRGTAMPSWERLLTMEERTAVVAYIKTFFPDFSDPDFAPDDFIMPIAETPETTIMRVAEGATLFLDQKLAGCVKCHGEAGKGDGPEAGTQTDDWGFAITPANLTDPDAYKMGNSVRQIYKTLSTGLNGTPMPGYGDSLSDEKRWNLAMYVASLAKKRKWYSYLADEPNWDEPLFREKAK